MMKVILLEKIRKLGEFGDQVEVKSGYGRNYLIPSGKAVPATSESITVFEARKAELEKQQQDTRAAACSRAEKLNGITVSIIRKAGSEGKLFGSVGRIDVVEAIAEAGIGFELEKQDVQLPEGPIRNIGEYEVDIQLHVDIMATIKVIVVAEEGANFKPVR